MGEKSLVSRQAEKKRIALLLVRLGRLGGSPVTSISEIITNK